MPADREPQPNGCICDICTSGGDGRECTNVAPDGEDICDECSMGTHEWERTDD